MRLAAALFTFACLSACSTMPTEQPVIASYNDSWRQHQAQMDAEVIMQGMANARQRAAELARSSR